MPVLQAANCHCIYSHSLQQVCCRLRTATVLTVIRRCAAGYEFEECDDQLVHKRAKWRDQGQQARRAANPARELNREAAAKAAEAAERCFEQLYEPPCRRATSLLQFSVAVFVSRIPVSISLCPTLSRPRISGWCCAGPMSAHNPQFSCVIE